ncbi:MAG: electron transporter, partial [Microbacterium sp.]|nr:electron transporter [Microbacterium sp.]
MKRTLVIIGGIVAAGVLVIGLFVFQPWLLFTDVRVDEALPTVQSSQPAASPEPGSSATPTPDPMPVVLGSGTFVSQEHTTTGTA